MTLAEELARKYAMGLDPAVGPFQPNLRFVAAINEAIERCAQEAEKVMLRGDDPLWLRSQDFAHGQNETIKLVASLIRALKGTAEHACPICAGRLGRYENDHDCPIGTAEPDPTPPKG